MLHALLCCKMVNNTTQHFAKWPYRLQSIARSGISDSGIRSKSFNTSIGVRICDTTLEVIADFISGFASRAVLNWARKHFRRVTHYIQTYPMIVILHLKCLPIWA